MGVSEKYRQFAEECRQIAATLSGEQKTKMQEIAKAWDECANNVEARQEIKSARNSGGA